MRRLVISLAATAALILGFGAAALAAGPAMADPGPNSSAAVIINDFGCTLFDGNGGFAFTDSSHSVITSSGTALLRCDAPVTPPGGGTAVQWNFANTGALCSVPGSPLTTDWHETVSASGMATLVCHAPNR